jgi:hypothetical protein
MIHNKIPRKSSAFSECLQPFLSLNFKPKAPKQVDNIDLHESILNPLKHFPILLPANIIHHELILNWISTLFLHLSHRQSVLFDFRIEIKSSNFSTFRRLSCRSTSSISFIFFRPNLDKLFISLLHWCCGCFSGSLGDERFDESVRRLRSEGSQWQRENGSLRGRRRQWIQSYCQNFHAKQFSLPKVVEQPA